MMIAPNPVATFDRAWQPGPGFEAASFDSGIAGCYSGGICPCRVRDWKMFFVPTLNEREPSLVLVSRFCLYRKA